VALLDAGVELLRAMTPATLVAALRTREIARRAGVSPPTFFHHFRTVEEYATALVDHVFSPRRPKLDGVVTRSLRDVQRLRLPAEQSIAYHTTDLLRIAADEDHRVRIGLWGLGGSAVDRRPRPCTTSGAARCARPSTCGPTCRCSWPSSRAPSPAT
jgi:AcrR family transcriptional regulator